MAKSIIIRNNTIIEYFTKEDRLFQKIQIPFTPDIVVYCKGAPLYISMDIKNNGFPNELRTKILEYKSKWRYPPKIILIRELGMIAIEEVEKAAVDALDMFEDSLKIGFYAENFGGPHPLTSREINFIDTWEVENYRRQIAKQQK